MLEGVIDCDKLESFLIYLPSWGSFSSRMLL